MNKKSYILYVFNDCVISFISLSQVLYQQFHKACSGVLILILYYNQTTRQHLIVSIFSHNINNCLLDTPFKKHPYNPMHILKPPQKKISACIKTNKETLKNQVSTTFRIINFYNTCGTRIGPQFFIPIVKYSSKIFHMIIHQFLKYSPSNSPSKNFSNMYPQLYSNQLLKFEYPNVWFHNNSFFIMLIQELRITYAI